MINLNIIKDYYILIDKQGGCFGGGRIFESLKEVAEQFIEWGNSDERENMELYTLGDCLEIWEIDLEKYSGKEFLEYNGVGLNKTLKELIK